MYLLELTNQAKDFLSKLDTKQFRQVVKKIFALMEDPKPGDAKPLHGHPYWRADIGEYRIVYRVEESTLRIALVNKRNDDEIYKKLKRG